MVNANDSHTMIVPAQLHVVLVSAYRILSAAGPCTFVNSDIFIAQKPFQRGAVWKSSLLLDMMRDHLSAQAHWWLENKVWWWRWCLGGHRRPDSNGWSLRAIWASHWCACVCAVQCCNIIAMSLYCKDDKCYYSAASLHHSAAALVICFHCDAREQLQK